MKRLLLIALLLCSFVLPMNAQSDEPAILKLEEELRTAMLSNGMATFERLIDQDLQDINQYGQNFDRAGWLNLFRTFKPGTLTHSEVKVSIAGDTALVKGKIREISTSNFGRPQYLLFLHVWIKRADGWKLLVKQQQFDQTEGTVTPAGWNGQSGANFLVGTDTNTKRSGNASAFIKSKHNEDLTPGTGLTQAIKAEAYRGKRIRLTGYLKGTMQFGYAFPWMRVNAEHQEGEVLNFDNRLSEGFFVRPDWQQFSIVLDVPEQAAVINLGFQINGRGQVWLDDWQLEVVGKEIYSTNLAASEAVQKRIETARRANPQQWESRVQELKRRVITLPAAPINLDFETLDKP